LRALRRKEQAKILLESLHSPALLVETVFTKHIDEIFSDPEFVEEIILAHCQTASPSELRKMATQDREKGKPEFAYYLEVIADQRERGEFA
jgi:hypothetical protein